MGLYEIKFRDYCETLRYSECKEVLGNVLYCVTDYAIGSLFL